jgi:spore coat protein U-like protein
MKRFMPVLLLLLATFAWAAEGNTTLNVTARVNGLLLVSMADPATFSVVDANNNLIASQLIGTTTITTNYSSWKISIDSTYETAPGQGRLKLDNSETYIPYTFALKDGENVILSQFNTASATQPATTGTGKALTLYFYFSDDDTIWPEGLYRDTLVISVTTD